MMEEWKEVKLKDICEFKYGKNLPSDIRVEGKYPVFGSSGIISYHKDYLLKGPGIIVGRKGTVGKVQYTKENYFPIDTTYYIKEDKTKVDFKFLFYCLPMSGLDTMNSDAAVPGLNRTAAINQKILLPPLPTQRKIASILSSYDDLIENNLQRIKLLEEMAQITYEEWFVRMKFPGHEDVEWDEETGLPEGWERKKIGKFLAKVKSTAKVKTSDVLDKGDIPVIDQSRDFIKGYTNDKDAFLNYNCPLIIFGDHTRILKFINFPFARGADGTQVLLSKEKSMPQHLFYFSLMNVDLSNYHYARHFKFLKEEEIIKPIEEVALRFESLAKKNFEAIKKLRDQNQRLKEARDILLPRLMTGLIKV